MSAIGGATNVHLGRYNGSTERLPQWGRGLGDEVTKCWSSLYTLFTDFDCRNDQHLKILHSPPPDSWPVFYMVGLSDILGPTDEHSGAHNSCEFWNQNVKYSGPAYQEMCCNIWKEAHTYKPRRYGRYLIKSIWRHNCVGDHPIVQNLVGQCIVTCRWQCKAQNGNRE